MKELTIEEKVKAYDESIEKLRSLHDDYDTISTLIDIKEELENIFPVLKESEDERIKKELTEFLKSASGGFLDATIQCKTFGKWATWLEKQGELEDKGEISDGYHTFNELYYYRMLYNAAFFNSLPKEWVHKSKRHHDGEECFGGGWFIVMANLPTGQISNHYELKHWELFHIPEKEVADEWDGHTPQEAADRLHRFLLEKQGEQKPADKVEPKFKVGDWVVVDDGRTGRIIECTKDFADVDLKFSCLTTSVNNIRSWTIQDAKDGDVLYCENSGIEYIVMSKGINKYGNIDSYFRYNSLSGFDINIPSVLSVKKDYIIPATKEQRDLLFQKMKEAGYEWNAEKKELKKIEQKPKKCIYSKDNYTDEDRLVLCDGCEERCEYSKKEEPVSIWHDANQQPTMYRKYLVRYSNGRVSGSWERHDDGFIPWKDVVKEHKFTHWCYTEDLLKL